MTAFSPLVLALLLLLVVLTSIPFVSSQANTYFGAAVLRGSYLYPRALGWITFAQSAPGSPTSISVTIAGGLPAGIYALHVHQYGDLTSGIGVQNISTAIVGSHFNPQGVPHGCEQPGSPTSKHVGDIGNVTVPSDNAQVTQTFTSFARGIDLAMTNSSIIGRAVIMHNSYDHCTQPTGDAGTPIVQGVIGIAHPYQNPYAPSSLPTPTNTTANSASLPLQYSGDKNTDPNVAYGFSASQSAVATLFPVSAAGQVQQAQGVVRFALGSGPGLDVIITIKGMQPNTQHGFHVHLFGDDFDGSVPPYTPRPGSYSGADHFANAGGHFNPFMEPHGLPNTTMRHEGDLGNITVDDAGNVDDVKHSALLDTLSWNTSIIGRAVIVHLLPDTGVQPTGGAGDRLLAGIIGLSSLPGTANQRTDFTPFPTPDPVSPTGGAPTGIPFVSTGGGGSSTGTDDGEKEEEYIGAAVVIVLLVAAVVVAAMYVRFSYARHQKACYVCDCGGCVKHYCGFKGDRQAGYAEAEDTHTTGQYGALRD